MVVPWLSRKVADAEAIARNGKWVYVFGSHFGKKTAHLQKKRQFVARFDPAKAELVETDNGMVVELSSVEMRRNDFRFHRIVNDKLAGTALAGALGLESGCLGVRDQSVRLVSDPETNPLKLSRSLVNAPAG